MRAAQLPNKNGDCVRDTVRRFPVPRPPAFYVRTRIDLNVINLIQSFVAAQELLQHN